MASGVNGGESVSDIASDAFVAAVESIYGASTDPSRWPLALQTIADVFGDVGANMLWRRDDGAFRVILSPGIDPASIAEYHEKWWQQDIRALRSPEGFTLNPGSALTDRHLVSPDEIASHPIYTDFLARYGLRWVAGIVVSPDPRTFVSMSILRASDKPPFSDEELAVVGRLGGHVEKSLRLSIRLLDAELATVGLGEALSRIGIAVFALDSLGRVVFSNPAAQRLPDRQIAIRDGRLRVGDGAAREAMEAAVAQALRGNRLDIVDQPKPILLHRSSSNRPLVVYLLPVAAAMMPAEQFLTHTRAIVLVLDSDAGEPADPAVVRDVLGLTLGEARVAALIGSGLPPREAAEKLGITEETARTALKRVFSKVGVSRQSELTALLTKLMLR